MAEFNTPKRDNLNDFSLSNTPQPQATSTIARLKDVPSKLTMIMDKNKRVSTSSVSSTAESSLGILQIDQLDDIGEQDPFKKPIEPKGKLAINEKLQRERQLARETLERYSLSNLSLKRNSVGQRLPSHLLEAQSFRNNSDFSRSNKMEASSSFQISFDENDTADKSASSKISFAEKDFSARSSLANRENESTNNNEDIDKEIEQLQHKFLSLSQALDNKRASSIRLSYQSFKTDISESFIPADLAKEKMLQDDLSWMREKGLPVPNAEINASCISEFATFAKNLKEKSISEFFKEKCGNLSDISLGAGTEISEASKNPIPLIDESSQSIDLKDNEKSITTNVDSKSASNVSSTLSLTSIARALDDADDNSPSKLVNRILNKYKQMKNSAKTYTVKENRRDSNKENQEQEESQESQTLVNTMQLTNDNSKILKDTTNFSADVSSKLSRTSTKRDSSKIKITPAPPVLSPHQKSRPNYSPVSSRIAESPSRTLSELNLSSDNSGVSSSASVHRALEDDPNSWVLIKTDDLQICTQVPTKMKLTMFSKCNKWVLVKVTFKEITLKNGPTTSMVDGILKLDIPVTPVLIEPDKVHDFDFEMVTLIPACFSFTLDLLMIDMVTKESYKTIHTLNVTSIAPKIYVKGAVNDVIDFNIIAEECYKEMPVIICNDSSVSVPLTLSVEQQDSVFHLSSGNKSDCKLSLNTTLGAKEERPINIAMIAPTIEEDDSCLVKDFSSRIVMSIGSRKNHQFFKEIKTFGRVGVMKLEFETNETPLQVPVDGSKQLRIRNSGVLWMDLSVSVLKESLEECHEDVFMVEPNKFTLLSGERLDLNVSCQNCKYLDTKRIILLKEKFGRTFKYSVQSCKNKQRSRSPLSFCFQSQSPTHSTTEAYSRNSNSCDERASGAASSVSSVPSIQGWASADPHTKSLRELPLVANRNEVTWGCVKIGRALSEEVVIKNESSRRLKFTASIVGTSFKFQKDVHLECDTVANLTLHPNESKTLIVTLSPNQIGAKSGKINFTSPTNDIKKNIRLFGYGGHAKVELLGVSKDTLGNMWLSLGSYERRSLVLQQNFIAKNTGTVAAFISLKRVVTPLLAIDEIAISIVPENCVLKPGEERSIYISYNLKRDILPDLFKNKDVAQIATVNVYMGPEPTRLRLRNVLNTARLSGEPMKKYLNFDELLNIEFENEQMLADVALCRKESSKAIAPLSKDIEIRALHVIVERSAEHSVLTSDFDETLLYQSLNIDQTTIMEMTMLPQMNQQSRRVSSNKCRTVPDILIFTPPSKMYNQFSIISEHSRPMHFQIECKSPHVTMVTPNEGVIPPNGKCSIKVYLTQMIKPQTTAILVYVENEVLQVAVQVKNSPY